MALAPADFYAYSRATGVPVPEDPEERAALAPEVLEFRRNQLKGPESEGVDPLSVGIGLGLAAAGAGAGAYGIRSLLKGRDLPKQEGKGGTKFVDLEEVTKYDVDELQRKQANVAPPPSKAPDLVDIQDMQEPSVAVQQNETVESGAQQFLRRRIEEGQRNVTPTDEAVVIPQEERLYAPSSALPAARRPLREEKILNRLASEQALLEQPVMSKRAWNEGTFLLPSQQMPEGIVNYPSSLKNVYEGEEVNVLGPSSPMRETFSAFAQIDPEMVDRQIQNVLNDTELSPGQKEGAIYNLQRLKQASEGVRGEAGTTALALSRKGKLPYTELLDEPISGIRGEVREVVNPAYADAMKNYWARRSAELPHTINDYEKRKAAGLLNYQLPEAQRDSRNRAQTFGGWDKATSEALQEIYESEVGDIPQYITEIRPARGEEARARLGEQAEYTGGLEEYFESERAGGRMPQERASLPVYKPNITAAMRKVKGEMVGFPGYTKDVLSIENRGPATRYKGPEAGNIITTVPLDTNTITEKEIVPGVMGSFETTEFVHAPLQRVRLTTNPETGEINKQLVNFQIRLDDQISPYAAALVGVPPRASIQDAVRGIQELHGDDYATINKKVNILLNNTVGETPIMTRTSFDTFDPARREFINMLSGASFQSQPKGFLKAVNGEELPFTGLPRGVKSQTEAQQLQRTNVIKAEQQLTGAIEQALVNKGMLPMDASTRAKEIASPYLKQFNEAGVLINSKPQIASEEKRLVGQPLPDIMQKSKQDENIRSGYYTRLEPSYGGAVSSQLRNLLKSGAQVSTDAPGTPGAKVVYRMGDKMVSYPRNQLIETLKRENQDATNIAELTGITLKTEGEVISGPHQTLSSRQTSQPSVSPTQRSAKPGFYYNEFGELMREANPVSNFTGPARFAAGPASDVLSGDYPQGGSRFSVRTSPSAELQEYNRYRLAAAAEATPGGRMVRGAQQLGQGLGAIPAGLGALTESQVLERYGASGSQLQQIGNQLMAQAAYKRGQQPGATQVGVKTGERNIPMGAAGERTYGPIPPPQQGPAIGTLGTSANREIAGYERRPSAIPEAIDPVQARNDAIARHMGNYISAASQRMEGPASIQGVKLKGVGQNALRPYQAPSEGMIQQLMRAARRR